MMLADSLCIRFCMRLKDVGCNGSRRRYSHFCDGDDDVFFRALLIKLMEARIDKLEEGERNKKIKELADSLLCLFARWN